MKDGKTLMTWSLWYYDTYEVENSRKFKEFKINGNFVNTLRLVSKCEV